MRFAHACAGARNFFSRDSGAYRLQPPAASRWRTGCGARRRRVRHRIHPLDDFRAQAGEDQGRFHRPGVVPTVHDRRARSRRSRERARVAGYSALVITIDTAVAGARERDVRNGVKELLGSSLLAKIPFVPDVLLHPRWLAAFLLDGGVPRLENVVLSGAGPMVMANVAAALASAVVTWEDLRWLRKLWSGPLLVKGVLTGEDARRAIDGGADGIVVSNHGGRQLDTVSATLRALPEVVAAVNAQAEVLMDGGVRRGADIVKAVCMGAKAVLVGRAYAYGLGAAGHPGVVRALNILRDDVERVLRLMGCASVADLKPSLVDVPEAWRANSRARESEPARKQ